jgi:hypothetical protein
MWGMDENPYASPPELKEEKTVPDSPWYSDLPALFAVILLFAVLVILIGGCIELADRLGVPKP